MKPKASNDALSCSIWRLRMGTGVAGVGNEVADRAIGDSQPRRDCNCWYIVHDELLFCG